VRPPADNFRRGYGEIANDAVSVDAGLRPAIANIQLAVGYSRPGAREIIRPLAQPDVPGLRSCRSLRPARGLPCPAAPPRTHHASPPPGGCAAAGENCLALRASRKYWRGLLGFPAARDIRVRPRSVASISDRACGQKMRRVALPTVEPRFFPRRGRVARLNKRLAEAPRRARPARRSLSRLALAGPLPLVPDSGRLNAALHRLCSAGRSTALNGPFGSGPLGRAVTLASLNGTRLDWGQAWGTGPAGAGRGPLASAGRSGPRGRPERPPAFGGSLRDPHPTPGGQFRANDCGTSPCTPKCPGTCHNGFCNRRCGNSLWRRFCPGVRYRNGRAP